MTAFICLLIGTCLGVFAMCLVRAGRSDAEMEIKAAQAYCAMEEDRDLWRAEALAARQKEEEAVNG